MAWAAPAVLLWGLVVTASLGAEPIAYSSLWNDGAYMLRIDLETGLGELFPAGGGSYGLSFGPSGRLYGAGNTPGNIVNLIEIDTTTGDYSVIGVMNVPCCSGGLAFDIDGRLWLVTGVGDLYEIDPATAQATLVMQTGLNVVGLTGCGHRLLALSRLFGPPGSGILAVIDPDAGTVAPVGPETDELSTVEGGLAFDAEGRLWAVLDRVAPFDLPIPEDAIVQLDPIHGTVLSSLEVYEGGSSLAIAPPPAVCPLGVPVTEIPTLGRWPLAALAVLLALGGLAFARRLNRSTQI
jgi:hypothetical protein